VTNRYGWGHPVAIPQLTIEAPTETASLPRSAAGALIAFALTGGVLLAVGRKEYPDLHIIRDTSMSSLSGGFIFLLWGMGARIVRPFPRWIAIGFAATAALESLHVIVAVEWSSFLAPFATVRGHLRSATWPPLVAVGGAISLLRRGSADIIGFAQAVTVPSTGLLGASEWLPTHTSPAPLALTPPAIILAMVAHLDKRIGRFALLLSLMKIASSDMIESIRAETKLRRLNEDLKRRVLERTEELYLSVAGGSR
jgi:hypothetical protein